MPDTVYQKYLCDACGYIYDEAKGDPDSGLAPGTRFVEIPEDWECPLCGLRKADLRLLPSPVTRSSKPRPAAHSSGRKPAESRGGSDHVVIIGAGVAGWSVAEAIRQTDQDIPILMVTACEGLVYPKPALSMAMAQGRSVEDIIELDAQQKAQTLGIDVRTETRVIKIDALKKRITTAKGGIHYGKLVLALGAHQRELPVSGDAAEHILKVNDLASYRKLRQQLEGGSKHVTILGAGLIGSEFAEDLSSAGHSVTLVEPGDLPLEKMLPATIAQALRDSLASKGVTFRFHATLDSLITGDTCLQATLSTGEQLETDVVISAAGLIPNTELAKKTQLATGRGVCVDEYLQTSTTDIFAVGDCAEINGHVYAYIEPIRRQADTIASVITGQPQAFEPRSPLVRVKTPSYPLSICLPLGKTENTRWALSAADVPLQQWELLEGEQAVGYLKVG